MPQVLTVPRTLANIPGRSVSWVTAMSAAMCGLSSAAAIALSSMRDPVDHVIDAQLVRLVRGVEREHALSGPFPVLGDVVVEVGDHHQPPRGVVPLEYAVVARTKTRHRMEDGIDVFDAEK